MRDVRVGRRPSGLGPLPAGAGWNPDRTARGKCDAGAGMDHGSLRPVNTFPPSPGLCGGIMLAVYRLRLFGVVALALVTSAGCTIMKDAVVRDDLGKVTALLRDNPDLAFSKQENGMTPLHYAAW